MSPSDWKQDADMPEPARLYFWRGYNAREDGRRREENPEPQGSQRWWAWRSGWMLADKNDPHR